MITSKRLILCWYLFSGLVAFAVIGSGVWFFFGGSIQEGLNRQRFDSAAWKADTHSFANALRIRMVDDLLRRHISRGMTRDQVTALLGEPDKTVFFRDWDMVYWLGPERGFISADSEWLVFRFDDQKAVSDYRIMRD